MNTKTKTILGIILFATFLGVAYFTYAALSNNFKTNEEHPVEKSIPEPEIKKNPAPDFTVFDTQGNKVKLSDFAGQPIVLNFWASWCPPCKAEMPTFNEVYADAKNDIVFLMIDQVDGQRETQAKGQQYVDDQGFSFPIYFDNDQEAGIAYGISAIPTTLFIDSEGNIVSSNKGAISKEALISGIDSIKK
ncbi:MAG: TlpA family protein disulfide reductase [Acetobacterium sp.]